MTGSIRNYPGFTISDKDNINELVIISLWSQVASEFFELLEIHLRRTIHEQAKSK